MTDADEEEQPTVQQEQQPSDATESDAAVLADATDSPSLGGAGTAEAEAPAEPDGSPAAETTHVNASVNQSGTVDVEGAAQDSAGSPSEEATSGDDPDSAKRDFASASNTGQPGHEQRHVSDDASLHQSHEADAADSCSSSVPSPQPEANGHVEPDSPKTPEAPLPVAPPAEEPVAAATADEPGPYQDQAGLANEPQTIAVSPAPQPGVGDQSPPRATVAPVGHTAKPVRGTLAKPNRGFHGVFVTRNGRKLTPEDLVQSVERLSKADLFGVDMTELLAMYGNAPKAKTAVGKAQISPDEIESMVERLYTTKPKHGMTYKARPAPMKAIYFIENGAHMSRLEPIPAKPAQERTDFMCALYERCKESKVKSQQMLADKYLQPLCKPKVYSGPEGKAKITEIAQKLFAGESTK